jgi:regulator of replication initiation timing
MAEASDLRAAIDYIESADTELIGLRDRVDELEAAVEEKAAENIDLAAENAALRAEIDEYAAQGDDQ